MRAWVVDQPGPVRAGPLRLIERDRPAPGAGELLVRVLACGVCRTDLHLAEGDLPPRRPRVTPGHEVVGEVVEAGEPAGGSGRSSAPSQHGSTGFAVGDRVGVAWLAGTDGSCRYCRRGSENLCPASVYTGWDRDGGYAEYLVAPAGYVHRLPAGFSDEQAAPLLCAGIIGYRALVRAARSESGGSAGRRT
jgi:propanol-preferring alcohol dehydrogenase